MKSLQSRILTIIIAAFLLGFSCICYLSVNTLNKIEEEHAERVLTALMSEQAAAFDQSLVDIENSTKILSTYVLKDIHNVQDLHDQEFTQRVTQKAMDMAQDIVAVSDNAVAIYVRFAPAYTPPESGFLLVREGDKANLTTERQAKWKRVLLTRLLDYAPTDREHVAWYYEPMAAGKPIWLLPYNNKNISVKMISYVIPLYVNNTFIGVAGVDMKTDALTRPLKFIYVYETGAAFLTDDKGNIIYHPRMLDPEINRRVVANGTHLARQMQLNSIGNYSQLYTDASGVEYMLAYKHLVNGMHLVFAAPMTEIMAPRDRLLLRLLGISCTIIMALIIIMAFFTHRLIAPIKYLTQLSERMAEGNIENVQMSSTVKRNDEVGRLAESMYKTLGHLKGYIGYINALAYKDVMTGVRNKTAFIEASAALNEQIRMGNAKFGVIVFDVNNLKAVNDNLGHEQGDRMIIEACHTICDSFKLTPIYRTGGDEFVAILQGEDYKNVEQLLLNFISKMSQQVCDNKSWKLTIASGMYIYDSKVDKSFDDVFNKADKQMYANKRFMKGL